MKGWTGGGLLLALALGAPLAAQQPLTLEAALARAERQAYGNRIARAQAEAAEAPATAALRGVLPTLRFEGGYMRTTDPIGAFGTTLRQRTITPADFDPARLNYPSALSYTGPGEYSGAWRRRRLREVPLRSPASAVDRLR